MTTERPAAPPGAAAGEGPKATTRAIWAAGDYHRFATELMWELRPLLVRACAIGPGQRVLDVAAGSGNVAIAAADAGAQVVASDLTPENFAGGPAEYVFEYLLVVARTAE